VESLEGDREGDEQDGQDLDDQVQVDLDWAGQEGFMEEGPERVGGHEDQEVEDVHVHVSLPMTTMTTTMTMTTRKHNQRLRKLPQSRDLSHRAQWGADHGPLLNRSCREASLQIQSVRPQSRAAWRKKRQQEEVTVWPTQVDPPAGRDSLPSQQRGKIFSHQNSSQK